MSGGFYIDFDDWYDQGVILLICELTCAVLMRNVQWFTPSGFFVGLAFSTYLLMLRERR